MKYTLMHKNIPVADVEIYEPSATITNIETIHNPEHLPVGVHLQNGNINRHELNAWWRERSIPAQRTDINNVFTKLNIHSIKQFVMFSSGLSLSDCYWIKPVDSELKWEDINFFDNPLSLDMGDMLLDIIKPSNDLDLCSPDNTTEGCLKKRWTIIDGKRYLIKAGEPPYYQQPFNEIIASMVMERLGVPHIPYTLTWIDGKPYSVREDFITPDTELVSAWKVLQVKPKFNHHNDFLHYIRICEENGIKNMRRTLDEMIVLDYIIANEDRHFNNFGIIRNADTLEWESSAPIFDSGTSLGYNKADNSLSKTILCKPFKKSHGEQLGLVSSFEWLDFDRLRGIENDIADLMSTKKAISVLGENRYAVIADFVSERINRLEEIATKRSSII